MKTAWGYLRDLKVLGWAPQSREGACLGPASNSELKRWLTRRAVLVNGSPLGADDPVGRVESLVFFPSGRRVTMF